MPPSGAELPWVLALTAISGARNGNANGTERTNLSIINACFASLVYAKRLDTFVALTLGEANVALPSYQPGAGTVLAPKPIRMTTKPLHAMGSAWAI